MRMGSGSRQWYYLYFFTFLIKCQLAFSAHPQLSVVVYTEAPHLFVAGFPLFFRCIAQGTENAWFIADEVQSVTVIAYPDVTERVL